MKGSFYGACIDGPLFGKNLDHCQPIFVMAHFPEWKLPVLPPPSEDDLLDPDIIVDEYRFDHALHVWRWSGRR